MPYADPEQRRRFHRQYMRQRRWGLLDAHRKLSVYICPRHPFCRLAPRVDFENSFLITDKPEVKAVIEAHADYGRHIFKLKLDFAAVAAEDDDE